MDKFKPCPFCGEKWELDFVTTQYPDGKYTHIICLNCSAKGPITELDNAAAMEYWNLRYPEDADEEEN